MSGWGLKFFDFDNDGELDLFLANGNPDDLIEHIHSQVKYQEPPILFQNVGRHFRNISGQSGPVFSQPLSARGMAIGDFNNDGAVDVLISVNNAAPVLLRNNVGAQNHWLDRIACLKLVCDGEHRARGMRKFLAESARDAALRLPQGDTRWSIQQEELGDFIHEHQGLRLLAIYRLVSSTGGVEAQGPRLRGDRDRYPFRRTVQAGL